MRYWVQFYKFNSKTRGYEEGLGDRSVIFLDGRWSRAHMEAQANLECRKRKYDGWRVVRGNSLLTPFYLNAGVQLVSGPVECDDQGFIIDKEKIDEQSI